MGTTKSNGANAPADAPRFAPFPDGVPRDLPVWASLYLATLAETGGETLSANAAGVTPRLARQLIDGHLAFAEAVADARSYYFDVLANMLPGTSKPIGTIARLKSGRPAEYETALIVQNHTTNNLSIGAVPADASETLRRMKLSASAEEWAAMRGDVVAIDAPAILDVDSGPATT